MDVNSHHYDLEMLKETNPDIFHEFETNSNFVVSRTKNSFSSIGLDQCHEQLNKDIKGDGGMVGLTEDEDRLWRWMICSPEISRAVSDFETGTVLKKKDHGIFHHHEESVSFQRRFAKHVVDLTSEFEQLGNPFLFNESGELIQLDIKDVMGEEVVATVRTVNELGRTRHAQFRNMHIIERTIGIDAPIKKNKLPTFKSSNTKGQSSANSQSKELKLHIRLFSQMYISTQTRVGNMHEFFSHKTLQYPPALAKSGEIRSGNKSDLNIDGNNNNIHKAPTVEAAVMEGSVIVNMTKPANNQTFKEYCSEKFFPPVQKYTCEYGAQRIDVVFDTYKAASLKALTRVKRGKGCRRKVHENSIAPTNWHAFLRIDQNKTELFIFISHKLQGYNDDNVTVLYAYDDVCQSNNPQMDVTCHHQITRKQILSCFCMLRIWRIMATRKLPYEQ